MQISKYPFLFTDPITGGMTWMKEKHFRIVAIDKKTGEEFDKERIEGTLIERILYFLNLGKSQEEVVSFIFEQNKELLRHLFLTLI